MYATSFHYNLMAWPYISCVIKTQHHEREKSKQKVNQ